MSEMLSGVGHPAGASGPASFVTVSTDPRVFDAAFYLARYRDELAAHGITTEAQALQHWLDYGAREGRQGSSGFDPLAYLAINGDVAQAYGRDPLAAIEHYLAYGAAEGRATLAHAAPVDTYDAQPTTWQPGAGASEVLPWTPEPTAHLDPAAPAALLTRPEVFDAAWYLQRYRDELAAHGIDTPAEAEQHWLHYGLAEGRQGSPSFDVRHYLAANADVAAAVSGNPAAALVHYLTYGRAEGRPGVGHAGVEERPARDSALSMHNTNLRLRDPDNHDLGLLDENAPASEWYVVQWHTSDVITPQSTGHRADPVLGEATHAYTSASSALAIYEDPSGGSPVYELATAGGRNSSYGAQNLFLQNDLETPVAVGPGTAIDFDYQITHAAILKKEDFDAANLAQIHLGMVLFNEKTGETLFLQKELFESNNSGQVAHIDGDPNDPNDHGTHVGLYCEPIQPGVDLRRAPQGWVHAHVDLYQLLQQALAAKYAVHGGGTFQYSGTDLGDWRLKGVYIGTETAGTGVLTTQIKDMELSP